MRAFNSLLLFGFLLIGLSGCAQRQAPEEPAPEVIEEAEEPVEVTEPGPEAQLLQEPIRFYLDIAYAGTNNPRQRLDIFVPDEPNYVPMPAVIYLHSGDWRSGNKSEAQQAMMPLLRRGDYAVIAVGYRLTDESIWPAQLHDVKAAIRWVRARADDYGIDPQRLALWGESAGGHLALMAGVTNQAQDMAGNLGAYTHIRSDVLAVVNQGGVTNINALLGQSSEIDRASATAPEAGLVGGLLRDNVDIASAASPVHYVRETTPPVLSVYNTEDTRVPHQQGPLLHSRLDDAERENYLLTVIGDENEAKRVQVKERIYEFLDRILLGRNLRVNTAVID